MINQNCHLTLTKAMANISKRFKPRGSLRSSEGLFIPEVVQITKSEWEAIADGVETLIHFQEKVLLAQMADESEEHF